MKILKYKTASGRSTDELDKKITELLSKGYQPHGNPYFTGGGIAQAMVLTQGSTFDPAELM
jgi:hypothetical protein